MSLYTFRDLVLEVQRDEQAPVDILAQLLSDLSFFPMTALTQSPTLRLSIRFQTHIPPVPSAAHVAFQADGFCGVAHGGDFYLHDHSSLLHVQPEERQGSAYVTATFCTKPPPVQRNFWAFGLLKLLRPLGYYSLHAAGVVAPAGRGVLIVGASGSGKSTLTIGLIRQGWEYLSDDAVLLRAQPEGVQALALRRHFYIDASAAEAYADFALGVAVPDTNGGRRRRVYLEHAYTGQQYKEYCPHVLLFPRIVREPRSRVTSLTPTEALRRLLMSSAPQLFDRATMGRQLAVLTQLAQQTVAYEVHAGLDLYQRPHTLMRLLREAEGDAQWPG